ncbi:leucine-rich_repeat domain-containing protein [Hexamita inflata]|uniref:Leucine-rich repeat domain-containing protein n=1 Tax=Hexamita inflata TaxID=28002 RepID=A0AA86RPC3_9EUKA|nr:leucine-rich repeat domain-containing protein [Hexamita inflata]
MTEQNENSLNKEYDEYMTRRYESKIIYGNLKIVIDQEVTNLRFLEKLDISTLNLYISSDTSVWLRSNTLKKLTVLNYMDSDAEQQNRLNLNVDNLELENLEVLDLEDIKLVNGQLYNLAKFKKLHTLNASKNKVDLTHIHVVTSLTSLDMQGCGLMNVDQISSLINLKELNLSLNRDMDLSQLWQVRSLTKLSMASCGLKNTDQIERLINLEFLNLASNQLFTINSVGLLVNLKELNISFNKQIDITPLKYLTGLIKLNMSCCELIQVSALKPLINLQTLDLYANHYINVSELQYLKNLKYLNLYNCDLVSIYVLRPLVNLKELDIAHNNILYLDENLNEMKKLKTLRVETNPVSDFSSLEKHPNYNNLEINSQKYINIFNQTEEPSKNEVRKAQQLKHIERHNLQLKEIILKQIQNQHKSLQTALDNLKQEIIATINNTRQRQIQFTAKIVHIFQYFNQVGFE